MSTLSSDAKPKDAGNEGNEEHNHTEEMYFDDDDMQWKTRAKEEAPSGAVKRTPFEEKMLSGDVIEEEVSFALSLVFAVLLHVTSEVAWYRSKWCYCSIALYLDRRTAR